MLGRAWGIGRSLAMYHGIPGRQRRMARLYGEFLGPGDVGFDIGAHVGSRVRAWRRLGVRVVAVEPQPDCLRVLRMLYGRDRDVTIVPQAVGAARGRSRLAVSTATPTVSSMSPSWSKRSRPTPVRPGRTGTVPVEVDVVTLDDLVATYGEPAFCKIDVEASRSTLSGLSQPLPALSFEYLPAAHDLAPAALTVSGAWATTSTTTRQSKPCGSEPSVARRRGSVRGARPAPATRTVERRVRPADPLRSGRVRPRRLQSEPARERCAS